MSNQMPTPEQVINNMKDRFGEVPPAIESAYKVDPSLVVEQAVSSKMSVMGEKNVLDPKTTALVFLSAAMAMGNEECMEVNTSALKKMGASDEEILSVVRIVRHAMASGAVGNAKVIFDTLSK